MFAAPPVRASLLGVYALLAEWQALLDPATEHGVAQLKLAWWNEEMERLAEGTPVHPISVYLATQPGAGAARFKPLQGAVQAAIIETSGVCLEVGAQLEPHSDALLAAPLRVASLVADAGMDEAALVRCTHALGIGQYLARAVCDYRLEAVAGRTPFPVDELLRAGVENADLIAPRPAPHLQAYLDALRLRARQEFARVAGEAPRSERWRLRHLLVLAALGDKHLATPAGHSGLAAVRDMLLAWRTARRCVT